MKKLPIFLSGVLFASVATSWILKTSDDFFEVTKNMEIFTSVYKEVNTYYVDELKPGELMKTGLDAMLSSLDPYTHFFPESQIEDARFEQSGTYGGIGASFRQIDQQITLMEIYENSPAQKAGLMPGDVLLEVNGRPVKGRSGEEVMRLVKGAPKTEVVLKVLRDKEELTFRPLREEIKLKNVSYSTLVENMAYIRLEHFMPNAAADVKAAFLKLRENTRPEGVILDLRGNPGGLLHEAVNLCNLFLDKGKEVVFTKGKVKEWNKSFRTLNAPLDKEIPIAVLVDGRSASASEIVAGTFQDYDRAVVLGNRTFGKGLVQITRPIKYNGQLKVTTSKYYTPSGRCIQAIDYSLKTSGDKGRRISDSLQRAFKTQAGRTVYDGGGVMPDIEVADPLVHDIVQDLVRSNLIFFFANKYRKEHPSIASPESFELTDAEYEAFCRFVMERTGSFSPTLDQAFAQLEKSMADMDHPTEIQSGLNTLKNAFRKEKEAELKKFASEIRPLLAEEIVSRYYYNSGRTAYRLRHDGDVREAIAVLKDRTRYKHILSSAYEIPRREKFGDRSKLREVLLYETPSTPLEE
ncbi:MAG: S41 family peptidase [Flavobacteriales bacterium]|nr:S41 family peptidase [Flavobacteriales bacterium]